MPVTPQEIKFKPTPGKKIDPATSPDSLVSIIVPLKNEQDTIEELFKKVQHVLSGLGRRFEMIFIDDGSTDSSFDILEKLYAEHPDIVRVIQFRRNQGKAAALSEGFSLADGEIIVTMDADLQDDPEEIPRFFAALAEGNDLVTGWKKQRHDPLHKVIPSRFFNLVVSAASGLKLHDYNCGFKAYRAEVVKEITLYGDLHRYIPFLANSRGFRVDEIVVQHHARKAGASKYGGTRYFRGFFDLLTVIMLTRFSRRPLHLFGMIGIFMLVLGFLINLHLTLQWFAGYSIGNRPLLVLGMLLMVVGVQMFSLGLVGEMINSQRVRDTREIPVKKILK